MLRRFVMIVCMLLLTPVSNTWADGSGGENPLTRSEVAEVKHMLVDLVGALGTPAVGYDKLEENYDLPTGFMPQKTKGRFEPISAAVHLKFGTDSRKAEKEAQQAAQNFQKKYLEAMAKGDMQTASTLAQQYQQEMGKIQLQAMNAQAAQKGAVSVDIRTNSFQSATIDPDAVLFEESGVIALMEKTDSNGNGRVDVFFDPVALKATKTLSQVKLPYPENGLPGKITVSNILFKFEGPAQEIQSWAKKIKIRAVLEKIK